MAKTAKKKAPIKKGRVGKPAPNVTATPLWTLDQALAIVRDLQPKVRPHYHIALGGGVINNGASDKDIDLYVLPMKRVASSTKDVADFLVRELGPCETLFDGDYAINEGVRLALKFNHRGRRIDVFIV